jgi:hypothetical protein
MSSLERIQTKWKMARRANGNRLGASVFLAAIAILAEKVVS